MSSPILRPAFSENQILSASDVNGIVDHARNALMRHNRHLHSWGIADGLDLDVRSSASGLEIYVTAGVAMDGSGREIVVGEDERLSEDLFDRLNVAESTVDPNNPPKYPVFIRGRDQMQPATMATKTACQQRGSTRTLEGHEITFGRVGDAALPQPANNVWRILLGFVEWDGNNFTAAHSTADGIRRRYAGVQAEDVSAQNDSLTLRSANRETDDKAALIIDNENDGEMRFGLQSDGVVMPVFTVNAKGDVIAKGKILGAIAGGVQVESGVITDGALVPLPAGITQQQVDSGEAEIQVHLSPRYQQPAMFSSSIRVMHPLECYANERRVTCRVLWRRMDNTDPIVLPGVCDYQIFGFVKAK
ncbi:MAG: hypothetical protein R3C53_06850 [Pirellulaceae bacterium]